MRTIIIVLILVLISCSTPYQPKGVLGGYSSEKIGKNVYRVEFIGNQHTETGTIFDYLERRCAEIAIENGYDFFIIYEDSSYVNETIIKDEPGIDELLEAQRSDKYLLTEEQTIDENPTQTLRDEKTKIARTYRSSVGENRATDVIGVYKIMLVNDIIENYKEFYHPAKEIIEKYNK